MIKTGRVEASRVCIRRVQRENFQIPGQQSRTALSDTDSVRSSSPWEEDQCSFFSGGVVIRTERLVLTNLTLTEIQMQS